MSSTMRANPPIDTLQQVEVAEGVEILLRPAGPVPRAFAYLIDLLIRWALVGILVVGGAFALGSVGINAGEVGGGFMLLLLFVMEWGYYVICEAVWGRSPGKKAMGLKVVRTSGVPIGWGAAVLRNLSRSVDGLPWVTLGPLSIFPSALVGLGSALVTRRFQRIGDLLADTVVVYSGKQWEFQGPQLHPDLVAPQAPAPLYQSSIYGAPPPPPAPLIVPTPPQIALSREEQQAVVLYLERAGLWSDGRKEELANHLQQLTGTTGRAGVLRLLGMGLWLRDS